MTLNGKQDGFAMHDFEACGKLVRLKQGQAKAIVGEIQAVASSWREYADAAGVHPDQRDKIQPALRHEPLT